MNSAYRWVQTFGLQLVTTDAGQTALVMTPSARLDPDFMCMSVDEARHALNNGHTALVECGDVAAVAALLGVKAQEVGV